MASRATAFISGFCVVLCFLGSTLPLASAEVECYVCPEGKLSNCAPSGTASSFTQKVEYVLMNCSYGCGKLISWNPKPPTKPSYVGLRNTVRSLEYKYCASKQDWTGCYKSESAITSSIECLCTEHRCNGANRPGSAGFAAAVVPLMFAAAAWSMLAA